MRDILQAIIEVFFIAAGVTALWVLAATIKEMFE
jgi:hypothetical protein